MKQKSYSIGSLKFSSKKKAYEHTKNIIYQLGCCDICPEHDKFSFFMDLLRNHQSFDNKIGCGVSHFEIKPNAYNCYALATDICRKDGSIVDFSWKSCAESTFKGYKQHLQSALRESIKYQIYQFREKSKSADFSLCCANCKSEQFCQVDHVISFKSLTERFLADNKPPQKFDENLETHEVIFRKSDKPFQDKWEDFHEKNADLQILCRSCNLSKGSKKSNNLITNAPN